MADIRDISIGSRYTGDPNLGGGSFGVAQIDTRPLQQLASYTYYYKKNLWEQEQLDLEKQAKEAADFASYDLTNAIPKYAKQLREGYDELYSWVQSNPDVMDYKKNPKGWLEYKKRKNELTDNIKYGVSQEIIYKAGQSKVESETRPEVKAFLKKQLDDQIAANDIRTPLKLQQYAAEPTVLPNVPTRKFDIIRKDSKGDIIIDREITVADQKFINSQASVMALGLQGEVLDVNSVTFKQLSPEAQKFRLEESKKAKATGRLATVDEAEIFTEALQHFKDPTTGKIDMEKVSASNEIIAGSVQAIDAYNQQMREEVAKIKAGYYSDNLGVLKFGVNGLDERDYKEIDYSDGEVTATDLYKVKLRATAPPTSFETTAKELNNPIQAAQLAETIRHNKASENLNKGELKLNQDKWKASQVGGETQINGAMERAKRIYNDLKKLTDKNGVIPPDKIRQLNVEQRKYLGLESLTTVKDAEGNDVTDANGNVVTKPGLKPLDLSGDTKYMIQLINGEIKVMADAELIKDDADGRYVGIWDNTRSTNINNVGTNILNEELKNAGAKELNSYLPIDVAGAPDISTSTSGGSKTTSSSKTNKQIINGYEIPEGATVVYSKKTGKALGYTLNGKNYQF